jgi:hypothetical protein
LQHRYDQKQFFAACASQAAAGFSEYALLADFFQSAVAFFSPLLLSSSSFPHISLASLGHPIRQSAICRKFPFATPLAFLSAQPFAQCKTAYIADVIHATM